MDEIFPLVYDELRRMAARKLREERTSHTLSATATTETTRPAGTTNGGRCNLGLWRNTGSAAQVLM